ncbi:hypothetical protein [Cytobacillus sp. FSL R5-0596]|uniref:hypothetical protein n=1 Tax=Cytobacillus sp. FSL R5-0596 TaxID=2954696 RepID=UPI0030F83FBD
MNLWLVFLIIAGGLLLFGFIFDKVAKKKNLELNPEEGLKNASKSEHIYKEAHLKQTIDNFNNPNS